MSIKKRKLLKLAENPPKPYLPIVVEFINALNAQDMSVEEYARNESESASKIHSWFAGSSEPNKTSIASINNWLNKIGWTRQFQEEVPSYGPQLTSKQTIYATNQKVTEIGEKLNNVEQGMDSMHGEMKVMHTTIEILQSNVKDIQAQVMAGHEYLIMKDAGNDDEKRKQLMNVLNELVNLNRKKL